jgi:hypothetical protein
MKLPHAIIRESLAPMAPVAPATGRNDAADHFVGAITACTLGPPGAKHELE